MANVPPLSTFSIIGTDMNVASTNISNIPPMSTLSANGNDMDVAGTNDSNTLIIAAKQ